MSGTCTIKLIVTEPVAVVFTRLSSLSVRVGRVPIFHDVRQGGSERRGRPFGPPPLSSDRGSHGLLSDEDERKMCLIFVQEGVNEMTSVPKRRSSHLVILLSTVYFQHYLSIVAAPAHRETAGGDQEWDVFQRWALSLVMPPPTDRCVGDIMFCHI